MTINLATWHTVQVRVLPLGPVVRVSVNTVRPIRDTFDGRLLFGYIEGSRSGEQCAPRREGVKKTMAS